MVQVTGITNSTTLTIGALSFAHSIDDPIRKTPYNQIRFYSSSSETGTYSLLAAENIEWDNKTRETLYNHTDGTTSTWYKFTYYNSTSTNETAVADSIAVQGGYALYCTVKEVLDSLNISQDDTYAPRTSQLLLMIASRTKQFDNATNSTFITRSIGSTSDYQYVDGKGENQLTYFLGKAPIVTLTELSVTTTATGSAASWTAMTSGRDNDYMLTKDLGMIRFTKGSSAPDDFPLSIRWYGTWGYSYVPDDVRIAVIKGVAMDLAHSNQYKSIIVGSEGFESDRLIVWEKDWLKTIEDYRRDQIVLI